MKNKSINLFSLVLFLTVTLVSTSTFAQEQQVKVEKSHAQQVKELDDHCWNFLKGAMHRYFYFSINLGHCIDQNSWESFFSNTCKNSITSVSADQMKKDLVIVQKLIEKYKKLNVEIRYDINLSEYEGALVNLIRQSEEVNKNEKFDPHSAQMLDNSSTYLKLRYI